MPGPWLDDEIKKARNVPLLRVLAHVADYFKEDRDYTPRHPSLGSQRFQVSCRQRDFRLILTGEKWLAELVDREAPARGGGGAIDLVMHLTGMNFVQAVKISLEAAER